MRVKVSITGSHTVYELDGPQPFHGSPEVRAQIIQQGELT